MESWTEHNIDIVGLDYNSLKANIIIPKITGTLSMMGSFYIIQDILRNPHKRKVSFYHRLMLGLSVSDTIYSFSAFVLTSWPMPRDYFIMAAGNVSTCDASAFVSSIGMFATPLYNCSLVTYYLLQLKYRWSDQRIRDVEKYLHIVPWVVGLGVGVAGLATKAFGPLLTGCWATQAYPIECKYPGSNVECIRGGNNQQLYFGILYFFNILFAILYVSISMFHVYKTVITIERNSEKYSFVFTLTRLRRRQHDGGEESWVQEHNNKKRRKNLRKRSRRVMVQGLLYSVAMILISIFPLVAFLQFLIRSNETGGIPQIEICIAIFSPLQGFFNTFIYLMPVFRKMCKAARRSERSKEEEAKKNYNTNYWNDKKNGANSAEGLLRKKNENGGDDNDDDDNVEEEDHPCCDSENNW
eukprot:CAMPEP_0203663660 /NCGR_PEP_ID=MMETSP0090-20130426/1220_1 /ASSEMBLY_ACC=CAM_ASM_001088 /TAXON_ID=426623 /ORGANISM="Chaetoceros affinis, Strain CCMP159" /LENGTH=411 /DNA_ID=CAMNT_0050526651 /DNA_START=137 /DNA_END=1369 /DNA_ORIENTATION=+